MSTYKFYVNDYLSLEARANNNEDIEELIKDEKGLYKPVHFSLFRLNYMGEAYVGRFTLAPMPGCCGIVISTDTWLEPSARNSGFSDEFRKLKHKLAKDLGYSVMIATTQTKDIPAFKNMLKSNYEIVKVFRNKRTDNDIAIGVKTL